jgi:capsular polysaccharide transport system permease protein
MSSLLLQQFRVIIALLLRETRATFGTSQIGYAWAILTPAIGISLLVFIFSHVGRTAPFGNSLALFFATGFLTVEFFNRLSTTLMTGIEANKSLLTYPLVGEIDVLIARSLLISMTYTLIMTLFFGGLWALDLAQAPRNPERFVQAFLATAYLGTSFGIFNAAVIGIWDSWRHIEKILTRPLIFISGVFYVPALLPFEAMDILWWNPVIHLVEWFRTAFYPTYPTTLLTPWWPLTVATTLLLAGLIIERTTRDKRSLA